MGSDLEACLEVCLVSTTVVVNQLPSSHIMSSESEEVFDLEQISSAEESDFEDFAPKKKVSS